MASFLLPSTIQKRLLRYALSRLELLDTDALDLDHLDISWGTKSTLEFRDVGLQLKKLTQLLKLPHSFDLIKARIRLLRVAIPVDIYNSPIVVEVEGVEAHVRVLPKVGSGCKTPKSPTNHDRNRHKQDGRDRKATGTSSESSGGLHSGGDKGFDTALPSAADLAKSFLQTEPPEEKAELEAAISSQSQLLGASVAYSDDGEDDYTIGTGIGLSLPLFMANFLKGIVDRLQVRVHRITLNVDVDISGEILARLDASSSPETVTLQLKIEDIAIEGITSDNAETAESDRKYNPAHEQTHKDGKRLISLRKLRGALISDASLFSSMSRSSALSSPAAMYSDLLKAGRGQSSSPLDQQSSFIGSTGQGPTPDSGLTAEYAPNDQGHLLSSSVASDSGRFDDAPEDQGNEDPRDNFLSDVAGDPGVLYQSAYLDQVTDSQFNEDDDDGGDHDLPFAFAGEHHSETSRKRSPLSTPRASVYTPPLLDLLQNEFCGQRSSAMTSHAASKSTVLPTRPRPRFAERLTSRSQALPTLDNHTTLGGQPFNLPNAGSSERAPSSPEGADYISGGSTPSGEDDLAQSKLFSHEDAESMYMSALSHSSLSARVPGAWDSSRGDAVGLPSPFGSSIAQTSQYESFDNLEHALQTVASEIKSESVGKTFASTSTILSNPRPKFDDFSASSTRKQHMASTPSQRHTTRSSSTQSSISDEYSRVSKQVFSLDQVAIYLPQLAEASSKTDAAADTETILAASKFNGEASISHSVSPNVPGAFSTQLPRVHGNPRPRTRAEKLPASTSKENLDSMEIAMGKLHVQFDVSVGRLIAKLLNSVSDALTTDKPASDVPQENPAWSPFAVQFRADRISVKFLERLATTAISPDTDVGGDSWTKPRVNDILLRTNMKGLDVNVDISQLTTKAIITVQTFVLGYAKENILAFDSSLRMRASTRDLAPTAGVDLSINVSRTASSSRIEILTLPVHISIDLQRLDETFSWFGGLSSVLTMGSSMASNATVTAASPNTTTPKPRGVRFEAPIKANDDSLATQNKIDVRIGGFVLDLVGKECTIGMDTSAVKIVSREEGLGVFVGTIKVSGPNVNRSSEEPAIFVELNSTRVEFLAAPKDVDLDRLLSLITPSKAKYDRDDDILLDTLLRQRRQGSVLRITVDAFKTRVSNLEDLKYLPELGEEVSRLSTVAKYLPDDDRPGLLSLLLIRDFDVQVNVNESLGSFQFHAADLEVAQITFPALIALSVNFASIYRNGKEELLGAATDIELREAKNRSPAIMARMIGDEMEPVVKVKLWNLKVEYTVPLLMALLGLSDTATSEEIVTSIAASIATLTDPVRPGALRDSQTNPRKGTESKSPYSKAMMIDVGLRDCILGLNPLGLPSKLLVVMTEAHLSVVLPNNNNTSATVEMSKGSLLVIDDTANIVPVGSGKIRRRSFDGGSSQVADLCSIGFVSVSYISSAKAVVQVTSAKEQAEKCIDVELRDDLLVIESCADSTQTLIVALNGLKPPMPPSQEVKYRTKVIPVQDLLASLSGDAFGTAEGNYDFDEDFGPGLNTGGEGGADDEENPDLDFDSHYYQEDTVDSHEDNGNYESREGSVLFDQLCSHETNDGVLLESFRGHEQVHVQEKLSFQEDHFGTGSILEGTAHRWNSAKNTYDKSNEQKVRQSPLRVCVRDVHIIWNLFDGYDWQHTRDTISKAVQDIESKAIEQRARNERRPTFDQDIDDEQTVIGDFLFNSIYIGIPANRDPRDLAIAINQELNDNTTDTESVATTSVSASPSRQGSAPRSRGKRLRLRRSKHHKITFELKGVNVDLVSFPPGSGETESSIDVRVRDFDIFDHVPTSTWKKFATYMQDAGERESGASQIHLEILNVKPVPELAASEIVLKATVLPLRLHVDQDALDFITRFFEFKDDSTPAHTSQGEIPFLQRVEVNSIPVKLDFKPRRVDYAGLRSGHTTEFMNFLVLDEANMVLRHTIIYGISGFDKLGKCLNDIWMPDIKRNQLPGILAGLAPVRSLANVGGGVRDLVVVPMREYRKDGRVVRSISKGAFAFARTTGTELVKLGAKLAIGTQTVLQGAEEFLSKPNARDFPSTAWEDDELDEEEKKQISLYADQPIGVIQGLRGGYTSLERDLLMARDAIIAVPGEIMESGTAQGAARAVLRRAPTVILRPVIGASKAIGQTLMGATNSLDPQNRRKVEDKYKKH